MGWIDRAAERIAKVHDNSCCLITDADIIRDEASEFILQVEGNERGYLTKSDELELLRAVRDAAEAAYRAHQHERRTGVTFQAEFDALRAALDAAKDKP